MKKYKHNVSTDGDPGKTVTPTIQSAVWTGTGPYISRIKVKHNGDGAGTVHAKSGRERWVSEAIAAHGTVWIETYSSSLTPVQGTTFTAQAYVTQTGKTPSDIVTKESGGFVPQHE